MWQFLPLALIGAVLGFIAFWVIEFIRNTKSGETSLDRIFEVFHNSATILFARLSAIVSLLIGAAITWSGDPAVQEWLKSALDPKYSWALIFVLMVVTELSRWRTIVKDNGEDADED